MEGDVVGFGVWHGPSIGCKPRYRKAAGYAGSALRITQPRQAAALDCLGQVLSSSFFYDRPQVFEDLRFAR